MNELEISVDIDENYKGNYCVFFFFFLNEMIMFILKEYDRWKIWPLKK